MSPDFDRDVSVQIYDIDGLNPFLAIKDICENGLQSDVPHIGGVNRYTLYNYAPSNWFSNYSQVIYDYYENID